jgi:prevent-host-death family protein
MSEVPIPVFNTFDAKSNLSRLIDAVESGRETEIIIARNGKPAARLAPLAPQPEGRRLGVARGLFDVPDDIDGANSAIAEMFGVGRP